MTQLAEKLVTILFQQKLPYPIYDGSSAKPDAILISSNRKVTKPAINKLANAHSTYRIDACEEANAIAAVMDSFEAQFQSLEQSRKESLAQLVGTKKSNISRMESGKYNPSLDFLVKVAESLGKKVDIHIN